MTGADLIAVGAYSGDVWPAPNYQIATLMLDGLCREHLLHIK